MPPGKQPRVEINIDEFMGINNVVNPGKLIQGQQRKILNGVKRTGLSKRDGTIPATSTPLDSPIEVLIPYYIENTVKVGAVPTLATMVDATSTLPQGTYYVKYTYVTENGETTPSSYAKVSVPASSSLVIYIPDFPVRTVSANIYIGTTSNNVTKQANITANNLTQNTALISGVSPPTKNTTSFHELLAASADKLYSFYNSVLTTLTMTNPLKKADIYTVPFTNANNSSVLLITDGGNLKRYNGTDIADVIAATNDASPNPPNDLTNINTKEPVYCWVYSSHVFMSDGKDIAWYSKRFTYDYWPSVQYERWVRENDHITGPGIAFNNVCLIPMRRGWGILTGETIDNFNGNQFLNTNAGCIAPRSIQRLTYPGGLQSIAFLSDDGVHEIYDTGAIDSGVRQYSTKHLMRDKIDFQSLGLTEEEKKNAHGYFDAKQSLYILTFKQNYSNLAYVYDLRTGEWYLWTNIVAETMVRYDDILYYAGSEGHIRRFDSSLYSDWDDYYKTTGTPIDFDVYSGLISFEFSGYESVLDYYLLEAKMYEGIKSTLDVSLIYGSKTETTEKALVNQIFVWGLSSWDEAQWANLDFTDNINNAKRLILHKKGKYFQRRIRNNRDEPCEILNEKYIGRISAR